MSMIKHYGMFAMMILFWLCFQISHTEVRAQSQLASVQSLYCVFPLFSISDWPDGEPEAEVKLTELSFGFEEIDADGGMANAIGLYGPMHIVTRLAGRSLHFMQIGNEGPLYVTTVFDEESRDGKLLAVHTRHEYTQVSLPGFTSRPEQYYGECEIRN